MSKTVVFSMTLVNQILTHALRNGDVEVCGLVSSKNGTPYDVYPVQNHSSEPETRFEMEPKQLIDTIRHFRESDEELFAIYHSHPTSDAAPSARDVAESEYPDAIYLIVSLNTEGVLDMRGYKIKGDAVADVTITIE